MLQVTYHPSVVVVSSSGGIVSNSGFKRRRYMKAPFMQTVHDSSSMADRCMESISGITGERPEVLLFLQTGESC